MRTIALCTAAAAVLAAVSLLGGTPAAAATCTVKGKPVCTITCFNPTPCCAAARTPTGQCSKRCFRGKCVSGPTRRG